jgi:amino acid permease
MSSFYNILFGVGLIIIWIISGGLITSAEIKIKPNRNQDPHLNAAYVQSLWGAIVTWFLVALFILLIGLSIFGFIAIFGSGAGEAAEAGEVLEESEGFSTSKKNRFNPKGNVETSLFLILAVILTGITGVLAALAADNMTKSKNFKPGGKTPKDKRLKNAYDKLIVAAIISLSGVGLLIIGFITYAVINHNKKKKIKENLHKNEIELQDLQRLRALRAVQ